MPRPLANEQRERIKITSNWKETGRGNVRPVKLLTETKG